MNITTYFIKHPVIAIVINAMILFIGALSFNNIELTEYPSVTFSEVIISTSYPNANAELIETSVTNVLEEKLSGIEGIDVITSESSDNQSNITLKFTQGTSIDKALMSIREALSVAKGNLPQDAKEPIAQRKSSSNNMPFILISMESSSMDFGSMTHYAELNMKNNFRSVKGVASVNVWGQPYMYNIKLDNAKLYALGINVDEVMKAISQRNIAFPVGKFRDVISVKLDNKPTNTDDYKNIVVKSINGKNIYLKDIAEVKLETDKDNLRIKVNGKPGVCIGINKTSDANPVELSNKVIEQFNQIKQSLPYGLDIKIVSDGADYIRKSISNIKSSIYEAIILVLIIVYIFLKSLKATLIPLITIPISLLGSIIFLKLFGCSINLITLMGMVLAVGLVVDDAIVVLENIQRNIEEGLSKYEASIKGAKEISFSIVAMTLNLASVYMPLAFISGTIGQLFIEFAIALAGSVIISGVTALTLTPIMCSKILDESGHNSDIRLVNIISDYIHRAQILYHKLIEKLLSINKFFSTVICASIIFISISSVIYIYNAIPKENAPKEDRSLIGTYLPPVYGKNIDYMESKAEEVADILFPIVKNTENKMLFAGPWGANLAFVLTPKDERSKTAQEMVSEIYPLVNSVKSVEIYPWSLDTSLPGADESSDSSDISFIVTSNDNYKLMYQNLDNITNKIRESNLFGSARNNMKVDKKTFKIDINNNKSSELYINPLQIAKTIEVFFSGNKSLNFNKDGILYDIMIKGSEQVWDISNLYVTNYLGNKIPISSIAKMNMQSSLDKITHYNQIKSAIITITPQQGEPIEKSIEKTEQILNEYLPKGYQKYWLGAAKLYKENATNSLILFVLSVIFIFAILSIQFENFIDPLIILISVPLACIGGLGFALIFGQSFNIYTQVGLITLIGLITKHGILIVEFTNQIMQNEKLKLEEAIAKASTMRIRPILMTTMAMVFGAVPLITSRASGYEPRLAIGLVLIGGLIVGTIFTLFILPVFCKVLKK